MLRNLSWETTDMLARQQWQLYRDVVAEMRIGQEEGRRALLLTEQQWAAWLDFIDQGDLPAEPPLPEMLQRLGSATWQLTSLAAPQRAAA